MIRRGELVKLLILHFLEIVGLKEGEREDRKYQDLRRKLQKTWNVRVIIPLVVGSLGAIPKQFGNRLKETGITAETGQVQKTVLLGTTRISRKVLKI